ncbi:MAG: hypothetical protein V1815_00080 [Candidatus Woesearchaeota archaeon]
MTIELIKQNISTILELTDKYDELALKKDKKSNDIKNQIIKLCNNIKNLILEEKSKK